MMTNAAGTYAARSRYADDAVTTASPAKLLLMLYDRLVRDLLTAEQALVAGDLAKASGELVHAQEIVSELQLSLDVTAWQGGPGLSDLYTFLRAELLAANLGKDPARVAGCRELVEPLREAWRDAALQMLHHSA